MPKNHRYRELGFHEKTLKQIIRYVEFLGLITIAIATIVAGIHEISKMIDKGTVGLGDLLMLFLYLEVLAMVAIYLDSGKLPIRLPIYIAVVAMARYLILEMKSLNEWEMVAIGATITLLSISALILRYGSVRLPYNSGEKSKPDNQDI